MLKKWIKSAIYYRQNKNIQNGSVFLRNEDNALNCLHFVVTRDNNGDGRLADR